MFRLIMSLCLSMWIAAGVASEQIFNVGDLTIAGIFSPEMPPSTTSAAAYLTIENSGSVADRLIGLETPVGEKSMLHKTSQHDHGMAMHKSESLEIMPGSTVVLTPGGDHIMITEVKNKIAVGTSFPMTLNFERAGAVEVLVPVKAIAQ